MAKITKETHKRARELKTMDENKQAYKIYLQAARDEEQEKKDKEVLEKIKEYFRVTSTTKKESLYNLEKHINSKLKRNDIIVDIHSIDNMTVIFKDYTLKYVIREQEFIGVHIYSFHFQGAVSTTIEHMESIYCVSYSNIYHLLSRVYEIEQENFQYYTFNTLNRVNIYINSEYYCFQYIQGKRFKVTNVKKLHNPLELDKIRAFQKWELFDKSFDIYDINDFKQEFLSDFSLKPFGSIKDAIEELKGLFGCFKYDLINQYIEDTKNKNISKDTLVLRRNNRVFKIDIKSVHNKHYDIKKKEFSNKKSKSTYLSNLAEITSYRKREIYSLHDTKFDFSFYA